MPPNQGGPGPFPPSGGNMPLLPLPMGPPGGFQQDFMRPPGGPMMNRPTGPGRGAPMPGRGGPIRGGPGPMRGPMRPPGPRALLPVPDIQPSCKKKKLKHQAFDFH